MSTILCAVFVFLVPLFFLCLSLLFSDAFYCALVFLGVVVWLIMNTYPKILLIVRRSFLVVGSLVLLSLYKYLRNHAANLSSSMCTART